MNLQRTDLREAHAHIFQHGRSLSMVDLSGCRSPDEALEMLAKRASQSKLVLAHGARPDSWDRPCWPTLEQLDQLGADRTIVAWCFDYHALLANRTALKAAAITEGSTNPPGGILDRDRSGKLTGIVYERSALKVWQAVPEPSGEQRSLLVEQAVQDLVRTHGFVEIHDLKAQPWLGRELCRVVDRLDEPVRLRLWPLLKDLGEVLANRHEWECESVRLGGAKVFVDGTLNSRTAWMLKPFADGRPECPCGTPMMTPAQIEQAVARCDQAGIPLAAHAIGDAAVRAVLDAIETVKPKTNGYRIEHCEVIDEVDIDRLRDLGVIASVQPCHLLYDVEALHRCMPNRLERVLPLRDLIESGLEPGVDLIFGSDVPIVRANPADSVLAATRRRNTEHPPELAVGPEQAISQEQAWACFASDRRGSATRGHQSV